MASRIRATRSDSRSHLLARSPSAFASSLHTSNASNQVRIVSRFRDPGLCVAYIALAESTAAASDAVNAIRCAAVLAELVGIAKAVKKVVHGVKVIGNSFFGLRVPVAACRWVINGPSVREPWLTGNLLADRTTGLLVRQRWQEHGAYRPSALHCHPVRNA